MINSLILCMALTFSPLQEESKPVQDTIIDRIVQRLSNSEETIAELKLERTSLLSDWRLFREQQRAEMDELRAQLQEHTSFIGAAGRFFNMLQRLFWVTVALIVLVIITRWLEIFAPLFIRK